MKIYQSIIIYNKQKQQWRICYYFGLMMLVCLGFVKLTYAGGPPVREYRYAIMQVPGFDGSDFEIAHAINDQGHIVGGMDFPGGAFHPFFWNGKDLIDLGTFGGLAGEAWDINNNDEVVGVADDSENVDQAFLWDGGELNLLGSDILRLGRAYCINDNGLIAGEGARYGEDIGHPILWKKGESVILPELDSERGGSSVRDINDQGVMAGYSFINDFTAVAWKAGKIIEIGSFGEGDVRSIAWSINDDNIVAGQSEIAGNELGNAHAFVWKNGKMYQLKKIADNDGKMKPFVVRSINDHGGMLGEFVVDRKEPEYAHPYVFTPERGMEAIERLLPPNHQWDFDYFLAFTADINNNGQIVGTATRTDDPKHQSHSYFLTPVEPELVLDAGDGPLVAGVVNELTVTGAEPGAEITFVYGKVGGGARIPGCSDLDAMLQIDDVHTIGTAVADENGVAVIKSLINPNAVGLKGRLLQAYDGVNCQESQLIQKRIE